MGMTTIIKTSVLTGNTASMDLDVTEAQLAEWKQGALIQDVMPHLSADEREFLITGITPAEWDEHMRDWDEWDTSKERPAGLVELLDGARCLTMNGSTSKIG
jgi:hypothetical protein